MGERDEIARAIHEDYVRRRHAEGRHSDDDPSLAPWADLPETLRESNRHQADDIDRKLIAVSCEVVRDENGTHPTIEFTDPEVEKLAKLEHERWVEERLASGWSVAPTKDVEAKQTPYLVPWEDLSEGVRDLDRDTVRQIPQFLATLGFAVVRRNSSPSSET